MKDRLKSKWLTKKGYILTAFVVFVTWLLSYAIEGKAVSPAETGIILGTLLAITIWLGPIAFVDIKKLKVKHPKDKFVEPKPIKLIAYALIGIGIAAIGAFSLLVIIQLTEIKILADTEGIVGSIIMMFLISSIILAPTTVYMLNALLRYKRIVEYNTAEWKKLHK